MLSSSYEFKDMTVSYQSGEKRFEIKYDEYFKLNGQDVDTDYARYENPYVSGKIERKAEIIAFSFNGKKLTLNFSQGTREF